MHAYLHGCQHSVIRQIYVYRHHLHVHHTHHVHAKYSASYHVHLVYVTVSSLRCTGSHKKGANMSFPHTFTHTCVMQCMHMCTCMYTYYAHVSTPAQHACMCPTLLLYMYLSCVHAGDVHMYVRKHSSSVKEIPVRPNINAVTALARPPSLHRSPMTSSTLTACCGSCTSPAIHS